MRSLLSLPRSRTLAHARTLSLCSLLLGASLATACKSRAQEAPAPKPVDPTTAAAPAAAPPPTAPAPAAVTPPASACLTLAAVTAAHPTEDGMDPCEQRSDEDLNADGLPELVVSCQIGMKSHVHTVYAQEPKDCYRQVAVLEGYWQVMKERTATAGFRDLSLMGEEDAELLYRYDPATRAYRPEGDVPVGTAPTIQLPKAVQRIAGIAGIAVSEPGFKGDAPACCLDCETMVPVLRAVEGSAATWAKPIDAAALRLTASNLRNTRWSEVIAETYSDKARKGFATAAEALAGSLEATAAALDAGDAKAEKRAGEVARAVSKLITAAGKLGEESQQYCEND